MAQIEITPTKTYATRENVVKAVEKKFGKPASEIKVRFFIMPHTDGRFFPVFVGMEAVHAGIHFHFNIIA